jgi:hypothetical protein
MAMVRSLLAALLLCCASAAYAEDAVVAAGPPPPAKDRCAPGKAGQWSGIPSPPTSVIGGRAQWRDGVLYLAVGKMLRFDPCEGRWGQVTDQAQVLKLIDFDKPGGELRSYLLDGGIRMVAAADNTQSFDVFAGGSVWLPSGAKIPMPATGAPVPRSSYALAAAEGKLIVWGGWTQEQGPVADGAVLDLKKPDAWKPMSMEGAPHRREMPVVAWTGKQLLIWGGADAEDAGAPLEPRTDGARYDVKADRWTPMSQAGAPSGRFRPLTLWTGRELLVLGGGASGASSGSARGSTDAAFYDPAADRWRPVTGVPANLPEVWPWINAWVDPHGDVLMLTTFGAIHLYFLDGKRGALEEVPLPPELQGRADPGFAWSGKRLFLWGGGYMPPSPPNALGYPRVPEPRSDAWWYEPR